MSGAIAIAARGITKEFPGVRALDDVSLDIRQGEVHALVGQNGAGKSTFIKIVAGIHRPDSGTLALRGEPVRLTGPADALRRGVVTISQETSLIPTLSVAENVFIGRLPLLHGARVDWRKAREESRRLLDDLGFDIDPETIVGDLPVAQQQGVEIARALSRQADIVIMDEPTSALAAREVDRLLDTVRRLRERGATVIYVSHRFDEIFRIADRMSVFREGRLMATREAAAATQDGLIELMIGRAMSAPKPRLKAVDYSTPPILEVRSLTRGTAFRDISFKLHPGEILGLSGLVGSGRTEIVRAIFGADPIDGGTILVDGRPVAGMSPARAVALGLALAPEDRKRHGLVLPMSVVDNLSLASIARRVGAYIRRFAAEAARARRHVAQLSIRTPALSTPIINLSGGNQQKVVFGKWLDVEPRIFIVDEPTRGIDVAAKADIFEIMKELADRGMAIIMISSEQSEILQVADRILVLREGTVSAEFPKGEASEAKLTHAAFGRLAPAGA